MKIRLSKHSSPIDGEVSLIPGLIELDLDNWQGCGTPLLRADDP